MRDLLVAEARRLRGLALLYAAAHLGALLFMMRVVDLLQQPKVVYQLGAALHLIAGLALGAWQLRAYSSKPSAWLYLLHRPLAPWRIALAILGAGGAAVVVAVVLPIAAGLLAQRGLTVRVLDTRHLLLPIAAGLLALAGYLAGALLAVAPLSRAPAPLVLLAWLAVSDAVGAAVLLVQLAAVAGLLGLAILAFRPDVDEVPRSRWALAALIAPMAAAWSIALPVASFVFQILWIAAGTHPNNRVTPMAGGHVEVARADAKHALLLGLAELTTQEAAVLRGQVELSEAVSLSPELEALPEPGGLTNLAPLELDEEGGVRWVFSHDEMRFIGMDREALMRKGQLGGNEGFARPPLISGTTVLESGTVRELDEASHRLLVRARLPEGEVLTGAPRMIGQAMVALGDRSVVFFDARDRERSTEPMPVIERVPLPVPIASLVRVDLIELLDGYLLSIISGNDNPNGKRAGKQWTLRVERGVVRELAVRPLRSDHPALSRMRARWSAPLLEQVRRAAVSFGAGDQRLASAPDEDMGGAMLAWAVGLSLLAGAWTWVRARRLRRSPLWAVAALAFGWPLALAFALVVPAPWEASGKRTKRRLGMAGRSAAPAPQSEDA